MEEKNKKPKEDKAIVKGNVVVKKESKLKTYYNLFFSATPGEVVQGIISNVIVPAIKNTMGDVWRRSGDMFLWGVDSKEAKGSNGRRVVRDYSSYSRDDRRKTQNARPQSSRRADDWKELGFDRKSDCEDIILSLQEDIVEYDSASVGRLLELAGIVPDSIHFDWGWDNLDSADCELDNRDGLWYLIMPRMIRL